MPKRKHNIVVGNIYSSKLSGNFKVIEYLGYMFKIEFLTTGYQRVSDPKSIMLGYVKDPMYPSILNIATKGCGPYNVTFNINGRLPYKTWSSMLGRCYNKNNFMYPRYGGEGCLSR